MLLSCKARWPISVLLDGIASDKIQLTEAEMQPTLAWNHDAEFIHIFGVLLCGLLFHSIDNQP